MVNGVMITLEPEEIIIEYIYIFVFYKYYGTHSIDHSLLAVRQAIHDLKT